VTAVDVGDDNAADDDDDENEEVSMVTSVYFMSVCGD